MYKNYDALSIIKYQHIICCLFNHINEIISSRPNDDFQAEVKPRPKTSDPRRAIPSPGSDPPKGAWTSKAPSPLVRPLSAGMLQRPSFTPRVDVDHILAEGRLNPNDPAVSLIAAIKTEIEKCSLPGSTTNLAEQYYQNVKCLKNMFVFFVYA